MQLEESTLNHRDNFVVLGKEERYHASEDAIYRMINEFIPTLILGMLMAFILFSLTPNLISVMTSNYHPSVRLDYILSGISKDFIPGLFDTSLLPYGWSVCLTGGSICVAFHAFFTRVN